jgi:hypothetical protein
LDDDIYDVICGMATKMKYCLFTTPIIEMYEEKFDYAVLAGENEFSEVI